MEEIKGLFVVKSLQWLIPFFKKVYHLSPKFKYVKRISSRVPKKCQLMRIYGSTIYHNTTKHARITIYTKYPSTVEHERINSKIYKNDNPKHLLVLTRTKLMPFCKIEILRIFAHELAHIVTGDPHSTDREQIECKIQSMFMTELKRTGYKSEEDELDNKVPNWKKEHFL